LYLEQQEKIEAYESFKAAAVTESKEQQEKIKAYESEKKAAAT